MISKKRMMTFLLLRLLLLLKFVITCLSIEIEIQHTMFGYVGIIIEEQQPATAEALLRDDRQGHTTMVMIDEKSGFVSDDEKSHEPFHVKTE